MITTRSEVIVEIGEELGVGEVVTGIDIVDLEL
jgi:hypothetical protein